MKTLVKVLKGFGLFVGVIWLFSAIGLVFTEKDSLFSGIILICLSLFIIFISLPKKMKEDIKKQIPQKDANETYQYPQLIDLEKKIKKGISQKKSFSLPMAELTKEQFDYLKEKYPLLDVPVTHEWHKFHALYLKQFESLKPKIETGQRICLNEHEESEMQEFVKLYIPNTKMNVVRPTEISTTIAGLKYHDYKKRAVKEMLEYEMYHYKHLDLEPEPENTYDIFAVKIMWEQYHLGYVPSQYSTEVAQALEDKREVDCLLEIYYNTGNINERTRIKITIEN